MKTVDLFKQYKCNELQNVQGKVFTKLEKFLQRRVIQLDGNVTTAATLNIPVSLNKQFLHFQVFVSPQSIFMINITFQVAGQQQKLSVSNLYKSIKYPTDTSIQHPCDPVQWGTIVIDCRSFFQFSEISNISVSGALSIKNIYNSSDDSLPHEFQLRPVNHQQPGKTILLKFVKQQQKENLKPVKSILKKPKLAPLEEEPRKPERVSPAKLERPEVINPEPERILPLLALRHIHGYTPSPYLANLVYLDDAYFAYPCGRTIVIMNEQTREQKFCSTNLPIAAMGKFNQTLIVACENKANKLCSEILQFDYVTCTKQQHYKLEGYYSIYSLDIFEDIILICAFDNLNRYTLLLIQNDTVQLKQISPFHIQKLRLYAKDQFITVGKENLRYWTIKSNTFQGHSPYLGNYARETHFTDVLIQDKRVIACCKKGRVFQFIDRELTGVWQISEQAVTTMVKYQNYIITTHRDGIKFWQPDFTEVIRDIRSEVEIIGCDSRKALICAFKDKSIARLGEQKFEFLVHSHQQDILDIALVQNKIVSSSMDHCICIWNENLNLEYQFRCLDALATCLATFGEHFIAGFDNGLLRLFDMKKFEMVLEVDTRHPILSLSSNNSFVLVSQENETLVLNHKLLIIKTHKTRTPILNGFNSESFFVASKDQMKVFSLDSLSEKYHLNIPISSVDFNDKHILLATSGHIKRFDTSMNFLQEIITQSDYVKSSGTHVFSSNQTQLSIYDYTFRADSDGVPQKQLYQQHVNKLLFHYDQVISFSEDYIFIWQSSQPMMDNNYPAIDGLTARQYIDIGYESQNVRTQKLSPQKKQEHPHGPPTRQPSKQQASGHQTTQNSNQQPQNKVLTDPLASPKNQSPKKQLVIQEQIPRLKFKSLCGYSFGSVLGQLPWNRKSKFYVAPANYFLVINFYAQESQGLILVESVLSIHQYSEGILTIHPNVIRIFSDQMEFVKSISYAGTVTCAAVSLCGNYLALVVEDRVQIYELSSGRLLTQSIIQTGVGNCYIEWCSKQELIFMVLTGFSTQLWRLNQRALLEYCDLELPKYHLRSCATSVIEGRTFAFVGQGSQLVIVDVRQARAICQIDNITQQEIAQVLCSPEWLVFLTNSPNIYFYKLEPTFKKVLEIVQTQAHIISLDSAPLGYSSLESDIIVATRAYVWYVDFKERVTVKMHSSIPPEQRALAVCGSMIGTSEGTIMIQEDEIIVPKRQCTTLGKMGEVIIAGYDDGLVRLFRDYQLVGQIKVGRWVSTLKCFKDHFVVGNESGVIYHCKGVQEVVMKEIQNAEFEIVSLDGRDELLGYSTGNQKVQILHRKHEEELKIKKTKQTEEQIEYYLMDSYRFRSTDRPVMQFSERDKEVVIIACGNILLRNFVEHLNLITIETQCSAFMQYHEYLVVGRRDGSVSLYDNEIELDKQQVSLQPIHMMSGNRVGFANMLLELL